MQFGLKISLIIAAILEELRPSAPKRKIFRIQLLTAIAASLSGLDQLLFGSQEGIQSGTYEPRNAIRLLQLAGLAEQP
jgi:hypothetical protein